MLGRFRTGLSRGLEAQNLPPAAISQMLAQADRLAQVQVPAGLNASKQVVARQQVRPSCVAGFQQVSWWCAALALLAGIAGVFLLGGSQRAADRSDEPPFSSS